MPFDGISIFGDASDSVDMAEKVGGDDKQPVFAESYLFEDMRMQVRNERSQIQDQLTSQLNAAEDSEAKNEVFDEMAKLVKQESTETLLEMQIKALGYTDAFVKAEGKNVDVKVLSEDGFSAKQAEEITYLIRTSLEESRNVNVEFQGES